MAERGIIFKDDFVSTPGKSWFDLSYDYLFSMNFGELVPSSCVECLAEDIIHAKSDSFVRLAPLVAPTFGKCNMFSYHFYVRNRSIWKQWEEFFADNDQREAWQQANPSWTPPEMPYIPVFNALTIPFDREMHNHEFGGYGMNWHSYNGNFLANIHVEGESYNRQNTLGLMYANALYIYKSNDQWCCEKILDPYNYYWPLQDNQGVIIFYAPNKYESVVKPYDGTGPYVSDELKNYENPYYNVFSNGSLFDYLGVDLSGYYAKQRKWFEDSLTEIVAALSDTLADDLFDVPLVPQVAVNLPPSGNPNAIPCSVDLEEFFKTHFLFGFEYIHNNQFVINTSVGTHLLYGAQTHIDDIIALENNPLFTFYRGDSSEDFPRISALPLRAYHQIYIDYFRDENYISVNKNVDWTRDGVDIDFTLDADTIFDFLTLKLKAYEHDPYTTALPQPQRGKPVRFLPDSNVLAKIGDSAGAGVDKYYLMSNSDGSSLYRNDGVSASGAKSLVRLEVDLSAATIENFRFANALQKLSEKIARSGGRYYEYMRAVYGADIQDAKIDRAIFLGGDKTPIQISEVLQTSASQLTDDQPLGQMAGRAVAVGNDDYLEYITPDNGFFIEITCALPRTNYQSGLAPYFSRFVRLDFATPDFAQLGEQPVLQKELWYSADASEDEKPFGYQSRYYDMKYLRDRTSGSFKDSLDFWTWSRKFDEAPVAGQEFLEVRPDYRQFAVTDKSTEHIYVHMWHDLQVNRCLPVFGVPSL